MYIIDPFILFQLHPRKGTYLYLLSACNSGARKHHKRVQSYRTFSNYIRSTGGNLFQTEKRDGIDVPHPHAARRDAMHNPLFIRSPRTNAPSNDRSKPLSTAGGVARTSRQRSGTARERRGTTARWPRHRKTTSPQIPDSLRSRTRAYGIRQQRIRMTEPHPANDDYEACRCAEAFRPAPTAAPLPYPRQPPIGAKTNEAPHRRGFVFEVGVRVTNRSCRRGCSPPARRANRASSPPKRSSSEVRT